MRTMNITTYEALYPMEETVIPFPLSSSWGVNLA